MGGSWKCEAFAANFQLSRDPYADASQLNGCPNAAVLGLLTRSPQHHDVEKLQRATLILAFYLDSQL